MSTDSSATSSPPGATGSTTPTSTTPTSTTPASGTTTTAPGPERNDTGGHDTGLGHAVAQTADPIDRVVRLAPRWTVFVLAACALLVLGASVWAFQGRITSTLSTPGILKDNGYRAVSSPTPGTVTDVKVQVNDTVATGDTLVTFADGTSLTSPQAGLVSAVYVAAGSQLPAGNAAIGLTDPNQADVVLTILPASSVGTVEADLPVEMEVASAPSSTYGYLKGRVVEVGNQPVTTDQVAELLDLQPEVVSLALGSQPGLLTVIAIEPDSNTPSRYAWTVGNGPNFTLVQGTPVTANVILKSQHPIEVLFPPTTSAQSSGDGGGQ